VAIHLAPSFTDRLLIMMFVACASNVKIVIASFIAVKFVEIEVGWNIPKRVVKSVVNERNDEKKEGNRFDAIPVHVNFHIPK
jgi:hypothetical protein